VTYIVPPTDALRLTWDRVGLRGGGPPRTRTRNPRILDGALSGDSGALGAVCLTWVGVRATRSVSCRRLGRFRAIRVGVAMAPTHGGWWSSGPSLLGSLPAAQALRPGEDSSFFLSALAQRCPEAKVTTGARPPLYGRPDTTASRETGCWWWCPTSLSTTRGSARYAVPLCRRPDTTASRATGPREWWCPASRSTTRGSACYARPARSSRRRLAQVGRWQRAQLPQRHDDANPW
jgi:hypothetical protein